MNAPLWLTQLLAQVPLVVGAVALMLCAVMAVVTNDRRVGIWLLLAQYLAVAFVSRDTLFGPLVLVRLGTGLAICAIVYISAHRVESRRRRELRSEEQPRAIASALEGVSLWMRICLASLCVLVSVTLWQQAPFFTILGGYGLAILVIIACALMVIVSSADPLRIGTGLLMALHGGAVTYLSLEQSLMAVLLLDVFDIVVALAIAHMAEVWLQQLGEGPGE